MAEFIVGRLFGWPDFSEDGNDVWIIHLDDPGFLMRVIHRPEDSLPSGELSDLYFPLKSDSRFAVGNLIFLEPRQADPRTVAELVGSAIEAIGDEEVARRLSFASLGFKPSSISSAPFRSSEIAPLVYKPAKLRPWQTGCGPDTRPKRCLGCQFRFSPPGISTGRRQPMPMVLSRQKSTTYLGGRLLLEASYVGNERFLPILVEVIIEGEIGLIPGADEA